MGIWENLGTGGIRPAAAGRPANDMLTFLTYENGGSRPGSAPESTLGGAGSGFKRGVHHIVGPPLDWERIARWTAGIVAGDIAAIATVFAQHGAPSPGLVWNPAIDDSQADPLRVLTAYWRGLAGAGAPPHLKQVDPVELRPALGYVMLLDAVEGGRDFRYRLYGSIISAISGFDMTGKLLSEHPANAYVTEFGIATYRAALQRREPVYPERSPVGAVQTTSWQRLALPLADDSGAIVRFLAGTAPIARDGRTLRSAF
jgi:hypothetical protein